MTSPQPPRPRPSAAVGNGVNEETLHLSAMSTTGAHPRPARQTAPSPYPVRPAFRPAPPPAPSGPARSSGHSALPARWEGLGFRTDIQGLRAVAIVLVLLSHAGFGFAAGGYVGVDVFFVVSGFLITTLLVKEAHDTGKISIAGFYARRARRILPAASAVTIATVVGTWMWFPPTRFDAVMQDAFTVIVYVVNYRFIAEQTEYLNADQSPSPFQQFWSLAVEEQFYLVWPLLLLCVLLLVKRDRSRLVGAAIAFAVGIVAISLILSVFVTEQSQTTAYYAAHTRVWELAVGALLALALPALKKTAKALAWILGIGGLAAIVASAVLFDETTAFPGFAALLPVIGTALVLIAGSGAAGNPVSSLLGTAPFQFFGKISYSLYLWHWPILVLAPLALDAEPTVLFNVVILVGTIAVAQFSYLCIEEPIRNGSRCKSSNLWGLVTGVCCSVLGIAMILTLTLGFPKELNQNENPVDLEAVQEAEDLSAVEQALMDGLAVEKVPADLSPSLNGAEDDLPAVYEDGCHLDLNYSDLPDDCVYGDRESGTEIVLIGDSHAAQWFPALEAIADSRGWSLLSRTKSACTPVSVPVNDEDGEAEFTECWDWKQKVFDELDELRPDLVVLATSDNAPVRSESDAVEDWRSGWDETLARVGAAAGAVVTVTDTPWAQGQTAPECLSLHLDDVQHCQTEEPYAIERQQRRDAGVAAAEAAGASVVDSAAWLCIDGGCPLIVGDLLVYRDNHHLSTPYTKSLANVLAEQLPAL